MLIQSFSDSRYTYVNLKEDSRGVYYMPRWWDGGKVYLDLSRVPEGRDALILPGRPYGSYGAGYVESVDFGGLETVGVGDNLVAVLAPEGSVWIGYVDPGKYTGEVTWTAGHARTGETHGYCRAMYDPDKAKAIVRSHCHTPV